MESTDFQAWFLVVGLIVAAVVVLFELLVE